MITNPVSLYTEPYSYMRSQKLTSISWKFYAH